MEDNYEDWKQIDGIFASMGVDGELSEESILSFLKKGRSSQNTVGSWLTDIGVGQYENVLIVNGFDNLHMLNGGVLEESDLDLMGITNTAHTRTVLREISKLPPVTPIDNSNFPTSVDEWLCSLGLEQYIEKFHSMDYTSMERVLQIWEIELAMVLSIVLLGHQKRILVSLGDNRAGFNTMRRKQRANISDISKVVRLNDVKVGVGERTYFTHNALERLPKPMSDNPQSSQLIRYGSPTNNNLERSDSGCSISSDDARPEIHEGSTAVHTCGADIAPPLPKKRTPPTPPRKYRSGSQTSVRQHGLPVSSESNRQVDLTMASYDRSQSVKQLTRAVVSGTPGPRSCSAENSGQSANGSTVNGEASDFYDTADYANLAESGKPVVGNVEGLKLSKAKAKSKKVISKAKRPLPDLPPAEKLTFTTADLPPDFKGIHKPEILINGCVNYSSCYLGTCLANNISRPESTREAIAKMKIATANTTKLPVVTLSISFKGVNFINSKTKRAICEHEITNIYCAAQDGEAMNYFAYITKDVLTRGLYCHVFCVKSEDLAREVIMTLGEAFDIAYHAAEKHPSLLDPDP